MSGTGEDRRSSRSSARARTSVVIAAIGVAALLGAGRFGWPVGPYGAALLGAAPAIFVVAILLGRAATRRHVRRFALAALVVGVVVGQVFAWSGMHIVGDAFAGVLIGTCVAVSLAMMLDPSFRDLVRRQAKGVE